MTKQTGKKLSETTIKTPPFRLDWPALLAPSKAKDAPADQAAKYSVKMVFEDTNTDYALLRGIVEEAAKSVGGIKKTKKNRRGLSEVEDDDKILRYGENCHMANATSKFKPAVVDAQRQPIEDESQIIPGSYAVAVINAYSYDFKGKGVAYGLQAIQLLGGGSRFAGGGGGVDVNEVFDDEESMGATVEPEDTDDGDGW